ncbi:MAG: TatD family nuclease-associated radical SAM protein [Oscillospiraceae bacterium]|nr:TatD family nuclease-associated radical SAM protein [Oscillospiraceae bacterium]
MNNIHQTATPDKAMNVSYEVGDKLYLNVTNRCPCACLFCIRQHHAGAYGSDTLWLDHEPTMDEMKADLRRRDLSKYKQIVFCGYGEPLMRLDFVCELLQYLRQIFPGMSLRIDSNGLADLYNQKETIAQNTDAAAKLSGLVDEISISLNAPDATTYNMFTRPQGAPGNAFSTMLHFAQRCKEEAIFVWFSVVDVLHPSDVEHARNLAHNMDIPLIVREYIDEDEQV